MLIKCFSKTSIWNVVWREEVYIHIRYTTPLLRWHYYVLHSITFIKRYDFIHYINLNALFSVLLTCLAAGCCFCCCCYYLFCFGCCCGLSFPSDRQYDIPEDYWLWYENESIRTSDYWSSSKADHDDDKKPNAVQWT